ncbi:hypothetical protein ACP26L_18850 [Paenibacillus sp. S-38]|uniref:hypothetical protein n=1 Tax=Paenibacillus sp. S-38 TaxID=3416710 RepID=UPI003CEE9590
MNVVILLIFVTMPKEEKEYPSNFRGDFSINEGGISTAVTPVGDLWIYISSENKVYNVSKNESGKIEVSTSQLPK